MILNLADCEYVGFDPATGKYIIHEQLYPECRGWLSHEFDSEEDALKALAAHK